MIRAIFPSNAFVLKQQSIKAKVSVFARDTVAEAHTLIDSGATENFISPSFISQYSIPTCLLSKTRTVHNVDGTKNQNGNIEETADLELSYFKTNSTIKQKPQTFFVLELGEDDMILGYSVLQATNPKINWTKGELKGTFTTSLLKASKTK
jgi:aspartyl protease